MLGGVEDRERGKGSGSAGADGGGRRGLVESRSRPSRPVSAGCGWDDGHSGR